MRKLNLDFFVGREKNTVLSIFCPPPLQFLLQFITVFLLTKQEQPVAHRMVAQEQLAGCSK